MKALLVVLVAAVLPVCGQSFGFDALPQSIIRYFGFTTAQVNDIEALNVAVWDYVDEKMTKGEEIEELLDAEVEKASPDPNFIGTKVVELIMIDRDIEQQMKATTAKVQAILTAEQKDKLKVLQDAVALSGTALQASYWFILEVPDDMFGLGLNADATAKHVNSKDKAKRWQEWKAKRASRARR
jgi:hypothetical protein